MIILLTTALAPSSSTADKDSAPGTAGSTTARAVSLIYLAVKYLLSEIVAFQFLVGGVYV